MLQNYKRAMKLMNNAVFGLIVGLIGATQVATAITADNPYTGSITNRNLFNLKPAPDPAATAPAPPPPNIPNIKLAGITTIMGGRRAILRVPRAARPPQPAAEVSLMLQEGGPTEEGVKVLEINIAAGSVKIDNNGTVQTLDLENDAPKSAPVPAVAPSGIPVPGQNPAGAIPVPQQVAAPMGGGITSIARPVRGAGSTAGGNMGMSGGSLVGAGPSGIAEPQAPPPMHWQEQEVLIELEKERNPDLPFPPTSIGEAFQNDQSNENQSPL